jgi:hypothetical protein
MVHFVGTDQSRFIDAFGAQVLPQFATADLMGRSMT